MVSQVKKRGRKATFIIKIVEQRPYVYAELIHQGKIVSVGFAKCDNRDVWCPRRGEGIAAGRAIKRFRRGTLRETIIREDYATAL